jgi:cytochrome b involved in lipid metabolism
MEFFARSTLQKKQNTQDNAGSVKSSWPSAQQRKIKKQGGIDSQLHSISKLKRSILGTTVSEVAMHNQRNDCWMIIQGKCYDVTTWIDKHPGGDIILSYAGK